MCEFELENRPSKYIFMCIYIHMCIWIFTLSEIFTILLYNWPLAVVVTFKHVPRATFIYPWIFIQLYWFDPFTGVKVTIYAVVTLPFISVAFWTLKRNIFKMKRKLHHLTNATSHTFLFQNNYANINRYHYSIIFETITK